MEYGDKPISFRRNTATKSMKLLQILLHCGEGGIARGKLLESLYGREELADVANNLRVTSHRLKKMLVDAGLPEYDYIQIKSGIYRWSSPMEVEVDVHVFSNLVNSSKTETSEDKKIQLLKSACEVYHGEFLPGLSGEDWVLLESVQYKKKYTQALSQVCDSLMKQREYETVLDLCEKASELYPFDEWQSVQVDCLMALNRYKEAIQLYEDTAKLFFEELGISPSEKMMNQFNEMSAKMSHKPQAINEIKGGLKEDEEEDGAFYCNLPSFRDGYRLVRRIIERSGQSVYLMLCTVTDGKGRPMENKEKLAAMTDELYDAVKHCLRRGDSFTKYSPTQFLILLVGTNQENCSMIFDRISRYFAREHKSWEQYLEYYVSSIADVENDNSRISFRSNGFHWN
ncbi:MAG: bacterial transcriptional activator domain-containing protein [Blautia producta]|nr:bacterial transcriptional activator domain-containing protein [Blautia producta]MDU5219344.1 bacterial transcriptional activator domain-containing protein [Blautia producta]MDU5381268.1 bacterial transcriptional activator domain-containing protein [Blautia producta]MDU6882229.1 bacterial transcriptional activator domain-containing protein [Blautia producta]